MKGKNLTLITFILIMIMLGISDSLRGVFLPIFQQTFSLDSTEGSLIITCSYIGNLAFLLCGGYFVDKYKIKNVMLSIITLWMSAVTLFILTENYYLLLIGMFICMGTSTLLSTTVNIIAPLVFITSPGMIINVLGFTQGVGTSGTQNIIGKYAEGFTHWKMVNLGLLIVGIISFILITLLVFPAKEPKEQSNKISYKEIIKNKAFIYLVLILGFYFIAEHGIMNWLVAYGTQELEFSMGQATTYLSIFFMSLTLGRLVLSPLVDRLGVFKSVGLFGGLASLFYIVGLLMGKEAIIIVSFSGIFFSIIYPTVILMVRSFYPNSTIATATGVIISTATLFDVGFNLVFGVMVDALGFKRSILVLPIGMFAFIISYTVLILKINKKRIAINS